MSIPQNPKTIVIKNRYYTRGLTQGDIWNYYQKNKRKILEEVRGRPVFFAFATDVNKTIIKRKDKNGHFFYLNSNNYDDIISGRTVAIYSTMNRAEDIGIIDIDVDDFKWAKIATKDVWDFIGKIVRDINSSGDHIAYTLAIELMSDKTLQDLQEMDSADRLKLFTEGLIQNRILKLKFFCEQVGFKHG